MRRFRRALPLGRTERRREFRGFRILFVPRENFGRRHYWKAHGAEVKTFKVTPANAWVQVFNLILTSMFKDWIPAFAGMTLLLTSAQAGIFVGPGATGSSFLKIPISARGDAMAGAFTAV